jgi:hypothetical protein
MVKRSLAVLVLGVILFCGWGGGGQARAQQAKEPRAQKAEEAYQKALETRRALDSTGEKLAVTKKFLDEFPESERTASALGAVFYYQGTDLGDVQGAVAYVEAIRAKVSDPEIAKSVDKEMISIYGEAGMHPKMLVVADRLSAAGALDFSDHWNIITSALKADNWDLTREYCGKARKLANAEAYRTENADRDLTDEDVAEAVKNREGMLLVCDAWARANHGELDAALSDFAAAEGLVRRSYIGAPEYDLNLYWGKALLMKGDHQAAAEKLAVEGLVMRNDEALAGLKKAYVGTRGNDTGFDDYAAQLHRSIAKKVDDFELSDYKGERHRFGDLRKDVTLLSFWFPT